MTHRHRTEVSPAPDLALAPVSDYAAGTTPSETRENGSQSKAALKVLRCSDTADFLAALPFLTGFTAHNSLFLVLFEGRRAGRAIRLDLPTSDRPSDTGQLLDVICALMRETGAGAEGPALVITCERTFAEAGDAPWRRFAKRLERRFEREGWWLRELACIAPDGWAAYRDPACPRGGRSLSEIESSTVTREGRAFGGPHETLDAIGALPEPDPVLVSEITGELAGAGALAEFDWVHRAMECARVVLQGQGAQIDPAALAQFIGSAQRPASWLLLAFSGITRPEFVLELATTVGAERFEELAVDFEPALSETSRRGWSIRGLLASTAEEAPDQHKLRQAIAAISHCTAHAPVDQQPALLALLAWAWWMLGMQTVAERLVMQALEISPGHELASMVQRLNRSVPAWHLNGGAAR
ncbi:DUF4192 family protein [Leucobacter sp. W1478]|uniref:DUF4192 family protein n=1 Tax=Leucobacter sp. W1478 TaxID=3439065 RepID=UPI003F321CF2